MSANIRCIGLSFTSRGNWFGALFRQHSLTRLPRRTQRLLCADERLNFVKSSPMHYSSSAEHAARPKRISKRTRGQVSVKSSVESSLPVAVEMTLCSISSDEGQLNSESQSYDFERKSSEIDTRFADLEQFTAVRTRDFDHAIELDTDNDCESRDWYERVAGETLDGEETQWSALSQPGKTLRLYGSPDPKVAPSKVPCHGCGTNLHCADPGIGGYVPSQIFVSATPAQLEQILCQRCYLLGKFNIAVDVEVEPLDFHAISEQIKRTSPALLLIIVDLTDLPNSFHDGFTELASENRPVFIIGNKVDLLPRDDVSYLKRIKQSVKLMCIEKNIPVERIMLTSAKTGYGIEKLITQLLLDWRLKGQVYILGSTNAGKSSMFNALLASDFCRIAARDVIQRATSSIWPGTTLNLLKFPIVNPKPVRLHERIERLKKLRSEEKEEEKLRREQLNETGHVKYATLMGYIGQTSPSLRQAALQKYIEERHASGFLAPSYSFDEDGTGAVASNESPDKKQVLRDHIIGRKTIVDNMRLKVAPYDDSTFKFWCYDTPGVVNPNQVINLLNTDELVVLLNKSLITPRTFRLKPAHVLFVSGLGRLDYIEGDSSIYCTVFAAESVPIHVKTVEDSDEFYQSNLGTPVLGVPLGDSERLSLIPPLVGREFTLQGVGWKESVADIVLSSIGWVSVTAGPDSRVALRAFTPGGNGCVARSPALLKYAVNLRGKRIRGTYSYHVRPPKFCSDW